MKKLTAILQVADCGPLESLVVMLRSAGWQCTLPNEELRGVLKRLNCDTVLSPQELTERMGYDLPMPLPSAGVADMARTDVVYIDVKAHRNGPLIWKRWPSLRDKTLWYRINGGKPEHVVRADGFDCGDEVNPPCPVLTPNQWYDMLQPGEDPEGFDSYVCWPPFHRWDDYQYPREIKYTAPICLIHSIGGWGYKDLIPHMQELGVKCHGDRSPDGLVNHREIPTLLSRTLAMVHLKSNDAPGYALYEAMAAGCPIICTRRLIWRCRMQELLIPGKTCLVFDRETHDGLTTEDVVNCRVEVAECLHLLSNPNRNREIGEAGRQRLKELMWTAERDGQSLREFLGRHFG